MAEDNKTPATTDDIETDDAPDLAALFQKDPLELSDDDVMAIVKAQRKSRHTFQLNEAKNKAAGKKPKVKLTGLSVDSLLL